MSSSVRPPPSRNSRAVRAMPERPMGGRENEAALGQMRAHQAGEALLRRGVERADRLVEQPDRPFDGDQPRDRQPAALAGREIGGRQVGQRVEPDRVERLGRCRRAWRAEKAGPKAQGFRRPRATASARPGGRDSAPARRWSVPDRRLPASSLPRARRTSPTMVRSSDDFPAPLRPVTVKASPEATAKLTPANTSRPPR